MKINYIILLHSAPAQAKRMISALSSSNTSFYIHVDKKVDIEPFKTELADIQQVVFLDDDLRCDGLWGGFGLVEAAINGLKQVVLDEREGYCVLLSGQDYPLRSAGNIEHFFEINAGKEFITCYPMSEDKEWWPEPNGMGRLNRYNFRKSSGHYDFVLFPSFQEKEFYKFFYIKELLKVIIRGHLSFPFKLFKKRVYPKYALPYRGNQWWALSIQTVNLIFNFLNEHPDFLSYFRDGLIPDEVFFQCVIKALVPEAAIEHDLTYTNWERKGVTLPLTFTVDDIDELKAHAKENLYARKFNAEVDDKILDSLDALIDNTAGNLKESETDCPN